MLPTPLAGHQRDYQVYLSTEQLRLAEDRIFIPFESETLLEKGSGSLCEDVLFTGDKLFGVFDGATSLVNNRLINGHTGGLLAAQIASTVFQEEKGSLYLSAQKANARIRDAFIRSGLDLQERLSLWSTSMAVVKLGEHSFEYCQTGDAQILLLYHNGEFRVLTPDLDIDRETLLRWKQRAEPENGKIHELLREEIQRVRLEMNRSYGVLNGEPEALDFLVHGEEELDGVSDILLFTDGLFVPRENPLENNDWQSLVELYKAGGLRGVQKHVRERQQSDPRLQQYPRFKVHDDIAAVSITFPAER